MFLLLLIIIVHELGHLITSSLFGFKALSIKIHCFGGITEYDCLLNESIYKEMIVGIMGPITQILFYLLVESLFLNGFVLENTFLKFKYINELLLYINLLPIIFFDGGKFLNQVLKLFTSFYNANIISIIISVISLPFLFNKDFLLLSLLLITFCIFKIVNELKLNKYKFNKFLLERFIYDFNFKKKIVVKNKYEFMCRKEHIISLNNIVLSEKDYLKILMKK